MKKATMIMMLGWCSVVTTFAGYEFSAKTLDGHGRRLASSKAWVDGAKAKIQYLNGQANNGMKAGSYILSKDGGKTVYMVNPQQKSYLKIDVDQLASKAGAFMNAAGGFMKLEFKNPKFKTILNERGPKMFGLPTRHIKTETSYTINSTFLGHHNSSLVSRKDEIWLTEKLNDSGMKIWSKQREIKTGNKNIDSVIAAESKRLKGVPLKVISITTTSENGGKEKVTTTVTEITNLTKKSIAAATFDIPRDYQNRNAELQSGLEALTNSIRDSTKNSKEGTPQKSVNNLLNGLFGGGK